MTTKYVICYLFNILSQMLTQYLVYICPFTQNLGCNTLEYLFINKQGLWARAELTIKLAKAIALYLSVQLLISKWRHMAIAVGNRFLYKGIKAF
jgi:hypothetical protein